MKYETIALGCVAGILSIFAFQNYNKKEPLEGGGGNVKKNKGAKSFTVVLPKEQKTLIVSSVCPHMGCEVNYKKEDDTFVCPCHSSMFKTDGTLIKGPAPKGLEILSSQKK